MTHVNMERRAALQRLAAGAALAGAAPALWAQNAAKNGAAPVRAARRIISLGGAVTESVYALGAQHLLVADR